MHVNYEVPILQVIAAIQPKPEAMNKGLECFEKILTTNFVYFYGNRYQIRNHVISLNIGRWQERRIEDQQKFFLLGVNTLL